MSFVSSVVIAQLFAWPRLRMMNRDQALLVLVAPHMFLRFIGLSFLVPGVVSSSLPAAFAVPAAYGDFVAGILAIAATIALSRRASWAAALVWLFNIWGAADFIFAIVQALRFHIDAGALGAAFFIPTAIVPPLLVTHALIFRVLVGRVPVGGVLVRPN
ncbi:MAG: hypothetical protein WAN13_15115 [Candidatus Acidiferrales bacterium]